MKRKILVCSVIFALASVGAVSCTRAKPEPVTPVPAAATTPIPTVPVATQTHLITAQPPPTSVTLVVGPTTVSVAEVTPGPAQGTTPVVATPSSPAAASTSVPSSGTFDYTVQWGDTLFSLARRFNTTVDALVALNGLQNASSIQVGQVLRISGTASSSSGDSAEYVVQAGDTLYSIARRYGTTVDAIRYANGIVSEWYIGVGQKLFIPSGSGGTASSGSNTYTVQAGDTLYGIAARFGESAWDLIVANNLSDPYWIWVGQVLVIP